MLYLIRGAPGSGKSTLAHTLEEKGFVQHVVEADQWMLNSEGVYEYHKELLVENHRACLQNTRYLLEDEYDVAVANCFVLMEHLMPYIILGFETKIIELRTQFQNVHNVPEQKIKRIRRAMQLLPADFADKWPWVSLGKAEDYEPSR